MNTTLRQLIKNIAAEYDHADPDKLSRLVAEKSTRIPGIMAHTTH